MTATRTISRTETEELRMRAKRLEDWQTAYAEFETADVKLDSPESNVLAEKRDKAGRMLERATEKLTKRGYTTPGGHFDGELIPPAETTDEPEPDKPAKPKKTTAKKPSRPEPRFEKTAHFLIWLASEADEKGVTAEQALTTFGAAIYNADLIGSFQKSKHHDKFYGGKSHLRQVKSAMKSKPVDHTDATNGPDGPENDADHAEQVEETVEAA